MKRMLLAFLLFCGLALVSSLAAGQVSGSGVPILGSTQGATGIGACGAATGYTNTDTITISAQGSLGADLPNNWVTYFAGNALLKSTGNGGQLLSSGTDVVFCTANNGTGTIIPYYFVPNSWSATTGAGEWYFQAPCIKKSSTCLAYLYTGKSSAVDLSCGPSGTNNCKTTLFASKYLRAYDFGGVSGGTLSFTDETTNAASPTNHGAISAAGEINNATNYTGGSSQWTDTGSTLGALTNFSIETWFNAVQPAGSQVISPMGDLDNGGTVGIYMIGIGTGGASCTNGTCMGFGYKTSGSNYWQGWCNINNLNPTGWHHMVGSHTGGSSNFTFYLDGVTCSVTAGGGATGSPVDPSTSSITFALGRLASFSSPFYYSGSLDVTRVMNFAMTADEALFDNLNQSSPTSTYTVSTP